jgi:hypothetical protein
MFRIIIAAHDGRKSRTVHTYTYLRYTPRAFGRAVPFRTIMVQMREIVHNVLARRQVSDMEQWL